VCLFEALGQEKAEEFLSRLKDNDVQILSGNKQVAEDVAAGKLAFGLTDTDDAIIELESGYPVKIIYPDSEAGQIGTLFIPNTLALLRGGPNNEHGRRLMDYLMTAKVESALARSESAQIPLHRDVQIDLRVPGPRAVHEMQVDFERAASHWDEVGQILRGNLTAVK
jgi:iron(III) transport system substrate-binding protein